MRTLVGAVVLLSSIFAVAATADAARKSKRGATSPYYFVPRYDQREQVECERARNEDPAGQYAGYPCWAREIFARGSSGGRGR